MWKLMKISQQTYFIHCNFNTNKEEVTLILYDLKETWSQTIALKDVKLKVKALNKRFDFSEDNIKEALTNGVLQYVDIEEQPHASAIKLESCLLKVKYGIKNCVLNYEWTLRRQTMVEFQEAFVQPLLVALLGCYQQVEVLVESMRKKDAELEQYRTEGAVLNRKTLKTKPFDFQSFNKQYEDSTQIAIDFNELAKYVRDTKVPNVPDTLNNNEKTQHFKGEENSNSAQNNRSKETIPKRRKRRSKGLELFRLKNQLKIRKEEVFKYESSQSQSVSSGNSQIHEINKVATKEPQLSTISRDTETNIGSRLKLSRRSTRNSPINFKREQRTNSAKNSPVQDNNDTGSDSRLKSSCNNSKCITIKHKRDDGNLGSLRERKLSNSPKLSSNEITTKMNDAAVESSKILNIFEFSSNTETNQVIKEPVDKKSIALETVKSKNLCYLPATPVIDDLSSQLNNIKKELECLEAMRLADLKKRTCKT